MNSFKPIPIKERLRQLQAVYNDFEAAAALYKSEAVCSKGCSYCCSDAGSIHVSTLEGLAIRFGLERLSRQRQLNVKKALATDMKRKEKGQSSPCPFLMKNKACMIYGARPFVCRRIYSLQVCSKSQHPVVSRRVMKLGDDTIARLQALDDTGYSGHLSYIYHMLDSPAFLKTYLAGSFYPEEIIDFGKAHQIVINRMIASDQRPPKA